MKTDGLSFFVDDNHDTKELNDAFVGSMTYQPVVSSDKITVLVYTWLKKNYYVFLIIYQLLDVQETVSKCK